MLTLVYFSITTVLSATPPDHKAPAGYLWQPAFSLDTVRRGPCTFLMSRSQAIWCS